MDGDPYQRERSFHNAVRECILYLLFLIIFYISSYILIYTFRKRKEEFYGDDEDAIVYRISLWMCTFSLAISLGAALLLPISIISNEVLLLYPSSQYVEWLNSSLIQGLWNYVFLFSNVSIFVLLPFAYLFTESEGLPGSKKGIMARVYETFLVLMLLAMLTLGMTYILSRLLDYTQASIESLFNLWNYYLPFLYSCVSCMGVIMLLVCTPVGVARLFTVVGELVVKPKFLRNIQEEYDVAVLEEDNIKRKIKTLNFEATLNPKNGVHSLHHQLEEVVKLREDLESRQKVSSIRRNLGYPVVMILLLALTGISVLIVAENTLELLVGIKALPLSSQQFSLGISSLSALGTVGASLGIGLLLYLWLASVVGLYTLPVFRHLRPRLHNTPMTHVIGNCAVLLVLSSALPLLARTLGITNFDLLGDFGRIEWLGSFYIVLFYNLVFIVATALCLVTKFTDAMRNELIYRLQLWRWWTVRRGRVSTRHRATSYSKED